MSTEAQISANRENAQKSTGPQSPEGKAAVSQNAVKHGLSASQAVVKGENREDFDLFRDEMLAGLAPVGAVESMLAERVVGLSWRLKRAERIQNQAIDVMIARDEPSPLTLQLKAMLPEHLRDAQDDPRGAGPELVLGRAAIKDYANSRVLDRLSMYERRIENSLFKTMHELERLRLTREVRQTDAGEAEFAADTAAPRDDEVNLAKQSQFAPARTSARLSLTKDYKNKSAPRPGRNKAKQSQFRGGQSEREPLSNQRGANKEPWRPY